MLVLSRQHLLQLCRSMCPHTCGDSSHRWPAGLCLLWQGWVLHLTHSWKVFQAGSYFQKQPANFRTENRGCTGAPQEEMVEGARGCCPMQPTEDMPTGWGGSVLRGNAPPTGSQSRWICMLLPDFLPACPITRLAVHSQSHKCASHRCSSSANTSERSSAKHCMG